MEGSLIQDFPVRARLQQTSGSVQRIQDTARLLGMPLSDTNGDIAGFCGNSGAKIRFQI
jgi:hypothetical protein